MLLTNRCAISDTAKVQHVKFQKVVANKVATHAGVFQSDQRTGRKGRRQKAYSKLVDGKYQVASSERENSESQRLVTGGERQYETLCGNGGRCGNKDIKTITGRRDEEERFQADLKKAVSQSLGRFAKFSCCDYDCLIDNLNCIYHVSPSHDILFI